jgi:hypothetical protein
MQDGSEKMTTVPSGLSEVVTYNGSTVKPSAVGVEAQARQRRQKTMGKWWCICEQLDGSDGTGND